MRARGGSQIIYKLTPGRLGRAGSLVLRTANNLVGGVTWVFWARFIHLQPQAPEAASVVGKEMAATTQAAPPPLAGAPVAAAPHNVTNPLTPLGELRASPGSSPGRQRAL